MAVASPFQTQCRVIFALILREVHTMYGGTALGYLWAIITTAFGILIFWGLRSFIGMVPPHGMSILAYLGMGFFVWNTLSECITRSINAVEGNRAMLTFPQVTPLDLIISRVCVIWATETISFFVIMAIGSLLGIPIIIHDLPLFLFVLFDIALLGLGLATTIASLTVLIPTLKRIIPMIMRIMFFMSGIFFSVSMFANKVSSVLLLNPIMQLIELGRQSVALGYVSSLVSIDYLCWITLGSLTLGFLLERFVRPLDENE